MVNFGIHRGQAVSPGDSAHRTGECSLASGSLEHLERAGWGPDVDPLLAAHAELPPRAQLARGYGSKGRIWARVAYGAGVAPAKERLNNLWNTTSLVSALLMTFTYGNIASPARPDGPPPEPGSAAAVALDFANVAGILSFIMSLFCLMFNVVFHEVDYCTSPRDERDFILSFAGVFDAVAGLFAGSVVMLLLSVLCTIYVMHPMRTFWITVGTCIALAVALGGESCYRGHVRVRERTDRPPRSPSPCSRATGCGCVWRELWSTRLVAVAVVTAAAALAPKWPQRRRCRRAGWTGRRRNETGRSAQQRAGRGPPAQLRAAVGCRPSPPQAMWPAAAAAASAARATWFRNSDGGTALRWR